MITFVAESHIDSATCVNSVTVLYSEILLMKTLVLQVNSVLDTPVCNLLQSICFLLAIGDYHSNICFYLEQKTFNIQHMVRDVSKLSTIILPYIFYLYLTNAYSCSRRRYHRDDITVFPKLTNKHLFLQQHSINNETCIIFHMLV